MNNQDRAVLKKIVVATDIALTSLECILPKTTDQLKDQLTVFIGEHRDILNATIKILKDNDLSIPTPCPMIVSMTKSLTMCRLSHDSSPSYIAHMIIKGATSGSNNLNSFLKSHTNISETYLSLAKDLLLLEQRLAMSLVQFI